MSYAAGRAEADWISSSKALCTFALKSDSISYICSRMEDRVGILSFGQQRKAQAFSGLQMR